MSVVQQAGAITVRRRGKRVEVLIVGSRKNPGAWTFPKGHIERGERAAETAIRELREEAGVVGAIVAELGRSRFASGRKEMEVRYFLVEYERDTAADESRPVEWVDFAAARRALSFADADRLLTAAAQALSR